MGILKEAKKGSEAPPVETEVAEEPEAVTPEAEEGEAPEQEELGSGDPDWPNNLPEEQQNELEAAVTEMHNLLFKNPQAGKAFLDMIVDDEDPQVKSEQAARGVLLLVQQLDQKLQLSVDVIPYVLAFAIDSYVELAERVKGVQFDEQDRLAILAGAAEGAREAFSSKGMPAQNAPSTDVVQ